MKSKNLSLSVIVPIFNEEKYYGATCHRMNSKFDKGEIYNIERFKVENSINCEELYEKALIASLKLLKKNCSFYIKNKKFLKKNEGLCWGDYNSLADFRKWLTLKDETPHEFEKKIKAAKHSRFSGPYIIVRGHKFSYHSKIEDELW